MARNYPLVSVTIFISLIAIMKAVKYYPENPTSYSHKKVPDILGLGGLAFREPLADEDLVRDQIHSIYKFGWCHRDVTVKQFLRKTANISLATWQDSNTNYVYLLQEKNTQRNYMECILLKTMVPRKYLFRRSRMPLYYCQGIMFIVSLETYRKVEIHEFFLRHKINMPANLIFEFYHPPYVPPYI